MELGRAKGVPGRALERRYILRPTLPVIITDFALMLITMWTGAIILENVFNWPGRCSSSRSGWWWAKPQSTPIFWP